MRRIKVGIEGNGTVRIKLKNKKDNRVNVKAMDGVPSAVFHPAAGRHIFLLPRHIIKQMEIKVESVFQPKESDVEIVYALTGFGTSVDNLYNFPFNEVVSYATPDMTSYVAEKIVEHIRAEYVEIPNFIVYIHSHPLGAPVMSNVDKENMHKIATRIKEMMPDVTVFFGVHAVGNEGRRARIPVERVFENKLRWSSITKVHEVAFFDEYAMPVEVRIDG